MSPDRPEPSENVPLTEQNRTEETTEEPPLGAVVEEPQTTVARARDPEHERLSQLLASLIRDRDPKAKVAPDSAAWLDAIRRLIERDGRDPAEVERVIRWCQADAFWQGNILSAGKLRSKFDQLVARSQRQPPRGSDPLADWRERFNPKEAA